MNLTPIMTSRFTSEELHKMAIKSVAYNNEIMPKDMERMFTVSSTKAFYTEGNKDLFLMEIEDGSGKKLIEVEPEQLKAMFVLYENIADTLKLEE